MEENIEKNICTGGAKLLEKLNLFTIFHAVWLIEMYYLGINTLFNEAMRLDQDISTLIPVIVLKYNTVILSYFTGYSVFIGLVAFAVFLCGISIAFVNFIPVFGKYKVIDMYSGYGIYSGFWLAIICGTYKMYNALKIGFIFTPIILFIIIEILKKIKELVEEKTGIKFEKNY